MTAERHEEAMGNATVQNAMTWQLDVTAVMVLSGDLSSREQVKAFSSVLNFTVI